MSTVSWSIITQVNEGRTSMCTIVCQRLGKVGTIYWSIVMFINGGQMCVQIFAGQRKCGAFGTVVPGAML
jgi:hypothetical protein